MYSVEEESKAAQDTEYSSTYSRTTWYKVVEPAIGSEWSALLLPHRQWAMLNGSNSTEICVFCEYNDSNSDNFSICLQLLPLEKCVFMQPLPKTSGHPSVVLAGPISHPSVVLPFALSVHWVVGCWCLFSCDHSVTVFVSGFVALLFALQKRFVRLACRRSQLQPSFAPVPPRPRKMFAARATQAGRRAFSTVRAGVENIRKKQSQYAQDPHLHGADDPTWLRTGGKDKIVSAALASFVVFSVFNVFSGVGKMATSSPDL